MGDIVSFNQAEALIKDHAKSLAPQIDYLAADDTKKAIFFVAAQILEPNEYITLVTQCIDNRGTNHISQQQFAWALFPADKKHRGMWSERNPAPALLELAAKAQILFAKEPSKARFFGDYLRKHGAQANVVEPVESLTHSQ